VKGVPFRSQAFSRRPTNDKKIGRQTIYLRLSRANEKQNKETAILGFNEKGCSIRARKDEDTLQVLRKRERHKGKSGTLLR